MALDDPLGLNASDPLGLNGDTSDPLGLNSNADPGRYSNQQRQWADEAARSGGKKLHQFDDEENLPHMPRNTGVQAVGDFLQGLVGIPGASPETQKQTIQAREQARQMAPGFAATGEQAATSLTGMGTSPIQREIEQRREAGQPTGGLEAADAGSKLTGAIGRVLMSGGLAPVVESGIKDVNIAQNEPDEDPLSLKSVGRSLLVGGLMKGAGAAAESLGAGLVAQPAARRIAGNLIGQAGIDTAFLESQKAADNLANTDAQKPSLLQALKPTLADAAQLGLGAAFAGARGLAGNAEGVAAAEQGQKPPGLFKPPVTETRAYDAGTAGSGTMTITKPFEIPQDAPLPPNSADPLSLGATAEPKPEPITATITPKNDARGLTGKALAGWLTDEAANGNPAAKHLADISAEQGHDLVFGAENYPGVVEDAFKYSEATREGQQNTESVAPPELNVQPAQEGGDLSSEPVGKLPPGAGKSQLLTLTPEAQRGTVDAANSDPLGIAEQRRGVVPMAQSAAEAETTQVPLEGAKGEAYNAAGQLALSKQVEKHQDNVTRLQDEYDKTPTPEKLDELNNARADRFSAVKTMLGAQAEAGRALQILRGAVGLPPEKPGVAPAVDTDLKVAALGALTKVYGDEPIPAEVSAKILDMKEGDADSLASLLDQQFRAKKKPNGVDGAISYWKAALISGAKTLLRVQGAQALKGTMLEAERAAGSMADWAVGLLTKQRTKMGPLSTNRLADIDNAASAVLKEAPQIWRQHASTEDILKAVQRGDAQRILSRGSNTGWKIIDKFSESVFKLHAINTLPYRKFYLYSELQNLAKAQAVTEAKQGVISKSAIKDRAQQLYDSPTPQMALNAVAFSQDATYIGKNRVSSWLSNLDKQLQKPSSNPMSAAGAKVGRVALNVLIPFKRVEPNIYWDFISYAMSPVMAPAYGAAKLPKIFNGTLSPTEQRALVDLAARGSVSGSLIMAGWIARSKDAATGTDKSPGTRGTQDVVGRSPGAVLDHDKWKTISGFGPAAMLFSLGADLHDVFSKQVPEGKSRAGMAWTAGVETLLGNPFSKAQEELTQLGNPGSGTKFVGGALSGFVPAIANEAGGLFDKYRRDASARPTDSIGGAMMKQIKARTPLLRNTLPVRKDAFGKPMEESPANSINPTYPAKAKELTDPFYKELVRLDVSLPKQRMRPDESEPQFEQRITQGGTMAEDAMRKVFAAPHYKDLPDDIKKDILQQVRSNIDEAINKKVSPFSFLSDRTKQAMKSKGISMQNLMAAPTAR